MWSLISLVVAGVGLVADHMSDKEERELQEKEMQELRNRIEVLEKKDERKEVK